MSLTIVQSGMGGSGNPSLSFPSGTGTVAVQGLSTNIVSGTAQASTSGTSIDFTGIPSWVKRITVMLKGVSLSGTANCLVQIGTGGVPTTSGYTGAFGVMTTAPAYAVTALSSGFTLQEQSASSLVDAYLTISNLTGNSWVGNGGFSDTAGARSGFITGSVTLSGVLNLVRITTSNGTDTFDAGTVNILYE